MKMIMDIIEILENNRKFVLTKLKKYSVEEYEKEQTKREKQSEMMLEALKNMFIKGHEVNKKLDEGEKYYE